ncbi:hypothetical protein ESCOMMO221M2_13505 [Escherichia coli]
MKFKKCLLPVAMLASFTLAGCQSNADDHAADVYQTDQLNTKQETKTVNIISILPAKVAVDNSQNKRNAGNDSNLLIVFYVQIMPDDFVMQLHRF